MCKVGVGCSCGSWLCSSGHSGGDNGNGLMVDGEGGDELPKDVEENSGCEMVVFRVQTGRVVETRVGQNRKDDGHELPTVPMIYHNTV